MIFGKKPVKSEPVKPQVADLEITRPVKSKPLPVMAKAKDVAPSTFPGFEQEVKEEVEEEEVPEIAPAEEEEEPIDFAKLQKELAAKKKVEAKVEPAQVQTFTPSAQIISGEMVEGGLLRYVIVSNKAIGHIGEILPLE